MTEVEKFELRVRMDATVTIFDALGQATDWVKPGSEVATTWRGVPTEEELALRFRAMTNVTQATLEDVLTSIRKRIDDTRRGK